MSDDRYEIRKGTDGNWGIYMKEFNVRLAVFVGNTHVERERIRKLLEQKPEIDEAYVNKKAREIHDELYEEWVCVGGCSAMDMFKKIIRIVIRETRGLQEVPAVRIKPERMDHMDKGALIGKPREVKIKNKGGD